MANGQPVSSLRQLRALFTAGTATGLTDGQLLERFAAKRAESADAATVAETAFAALVDRHGAMVWGVCRRVLGDAHEAEDAFQATFLVLVRKAGSVRVDGSLGRWLYGVAHRVAVRARSEAKRRASCPRRSPVGSSNDPAGEVERRDLHDALDEEVDRLPAKYRCPIELCYLQGMTYDQAARQLNWPVATVKSRLTRGRLRLREKLARRGLAPGAVVAAMALAGESRAAVPQKLLHFTVRAATSRATGVLPAAVTDLTEGVLQIMMWEKIKLVAAGALIAVGLTAGALAQQRSKDRLPGAQQPKAQAQPSGKSAEKSAVDPRWVKMLPNGATIEVVGISPHPSGARTWWRPDGTPLGQPPCDPSPTNIRGDGDVVYRTVVVRITGVPPGADDGWWINQANGGSQGQAKLGAKPVPGLSQTVTMFPSGLRDCTVRFEVAAGPWLTVQTWGNNQGARGAEPGRNFIFGQALATKKGSTISVTHDIGDHLSVQLIAVDHDGEEYPSEIRSGSGVKGFKQLVVEFALPPEQIKEFWVQTRPYERVEVQGVALKPLRSP
jgi:RNA polymerase sigma factor (sigma-70 family)